MNSHWFGRYIVIYTFSFYMKYEWLGSDEVSERIQFNPQHPIHIFILTYILYFISFFVYLI